MCCLKLGLLLFNEIFKFKTVEMSKYFNKNTFSSFGSKLQPWVKWHGSFIFKTKSSGSPRFKDKNKRNAKIFTRSHFGVESFWNTNMLGIMF